MRTSRTGIFLAAVWTVGVFALAAFAAGDLFTRGRVDADSFALAALLLDAVEGVFLADDVVARLISGLLATTFAAGFLAALLTLFFFVAVLAGTAFRFAVDFFATTVFAFARAAATPTVLAVALAAVFFTAFLTAFFATFFFTTLLAAPFTAFFAAVFFTAVRFIANPLEPMSAPPIRTGAGLWSNNPFLYPA
ncbi:MAG: hypothetical protein ABIO49_14170 [Dokdonella sp.]